MIGIYKITNLVNNKVYIGQAIDIDKRWYEHINDLKNNKHINKHLQRAWNKYREENFKFEVIEDCVEDKLTEREQYWIDYYEGINSKNNYNFRNAGNRGKFSEISIQKRTKTRRGFKHSIETKQKMSKSHIGIKHTEETRKKLSNYHKGKKLSVDTINKLKEIANNNKCYLIGRKLTDETKEKIRQAHLGKHLSEEHKYKIGQAHKGVSNQSAKGRIWINNEEKSKMIYPEQLEEYKQLGYKLGRISWREVIK